MRPNLDGHIKNYIRVIFLVLLVAEICGLNSCSSREESVEENLSQNTDQVSIGNLRVGGESDSRRGDYVDSTSQKQENKVYGKVKIVDATGTPMENIGAIATLNPNAFDEPLAWGSLSGRDGISEIWVPKNLHLFIRAWDPKLKFFPNNFYEIPPTDADLLEDMTITMLESSSVEMTLYDSNDNPVAKENVGLMMIHSKYGSWWPCDGYTDENGNVVFAHLPPGIFNLRIKTESGLILEIKELSLPPGSHTIIGKVKPN